MSEPKKIWVRCYVFSRTWSGSLEFEASMTYIYLACKAYLDPPGVQKKCRNGLRQKIQPQPYKNATAQKIQPQLKNHRFIKVGNFPWKTSNPHDSPVFWTALNKIVLAAPLHHHTSIQYNLLEDISSVLFLSSSGIMFEKTFLHQLH